MTPSPLPIALLTDFGTRDWYVAAMKGEILGRLPEAQIIDVSHGVPPGQIEAGAFVLRCVMDSMPLATVFCCVVDPGVGGDRRAICGRIGQSFYSGPDNGLATPLFERSENDFSLYEIESAQFRSGRVSATFHGRDLFAPAAALLAAGTPPESAGLAVTDPVRLPPFGPEPCESGLRARVMWIDHFGNVITNVSRQSWADKLQTGRLKIRAGSLTIQTIGRTFGDVAPGEPLAYWGSADTLEIALNQGSAAEAAAIELGDPVVIEFGE
jgi:S-adenosylmethionine hydrolase